MFFWLIDKHFVGTANHVYEDLGLIRELNIIFMKVEVTTYIVENLVHT